MGTHGGEPLHRVEGFLALRDLGSTNPLGFVRHVGQPLLREGGPDYIPGDIFHGLFVVGLNRWTAMEVEAEMLPQRDTRDHFFRDFPFPQKHL